MKGTVDGFRLILIGDLHEQPMLQLNVKPFILAAKDWSSGVSLSQPALTKAANMTKPASGIGCVRDADQLLESHKFALGTLYDYLHSHFIR